jgi:hypothetical protein
MGDRRRGDSVRLGFHQRALGGDDRYEAKIISLACAQIRSNALLIDDGGNDYYQLQSGQQGFGAATFRDDYIDANPLSPYNALAKSFSLLLDIGGTDTYIDWDKDNDKTSPNAICGNNKTWFKPARDDEHYGANNFGVGMDVEDGLVPEGEMFR